jgi:nucleoside-diphosphate-sugar epimerase
MTHHLILGAGPIGRATATILARDGHDVTLASRSGSGVQIDGVRRLALDAADTPALVVAADGQDALYNCLNPAYHRWGTDWPPLANGLLAAAERSGAVLATASNLYAYGPVSGPMVEGMADGSTEAKGRVRAQMWADALAAHASGRLRAVEVRASDYLGPGVSAGSALTRLVPALREGKRPLVLGDPDQPHTWTDVRDVARTLVAVAGNRAVWGRVWHVPSCEPRTQREALNEIAIVLGRPLARPRVMGARSLRALGLFSPLLRELAGTVYQFSAPFVMDSTAAQRDLGLAPTPWVETVRATAQEN